MITNIDANVMDIKKRRQFIRFIFSVKENSISNVRLPSISA